MNFLWRSEFMDKIAFIEEYIEKCNSTTSKQILIREINCTFKNDIDDISNGLNFYGYGSSISNEDYSEDLTKLKAILTNYKCDLQREDKIRTDELRMLELKSQITINNNNHNTNNSKSNSSATAIATVTINQTMKNINELPEDILNKEDSVELKDLIYSIEEMIAEKEKSGAKSKISKVLETIGNKGFDLFVAVAPYLIQAAATVQATT